MGVAVAVGAGVGDGCGVDVAGRVGCGVGVAGGAAVAAMVGRDGVAVGWVFASSAAGFGVASAVVAAWHPASMSMMRERKIKVCFIGFLFYQRMINPVPSIIS